MKGNDARRQYLAAKLAAHTADDGERDEALGTILLSLFSREEVEEIVDARHKKLCESCPAKLNQTAPKEAMKDWLIKELIRLLGWVIVIIGCLTGAKELFLK